MLSEILEAVKIIVLILILIVHASIYLLMKDSEEVVEEIDENVLKTMYS
jgi:short subunit fatty acids transporter